MIMPNEMIPPPSDTANTELDRLGFAIATAKSHLQVPSWRLSLMQLDYWLSFVGFKRDAIEQVPE